MLSKEQIIENMANNMQSVKVWDNRGGQVGIQILLSIQESRRLAEAALNALIDSLPSDWEPWVHYGVGEPSHRTSKQPQFLAEYYRQLLNMKG